MRANGFVALLASHARLPDRHTGPCRPPLSPGDVGITRVAGPAGLSTRRVDPANG